MAWKLSTVAAATGLGVVLTILLASAVLDVPPDTFTRDPAGQVPELPFYAGSVSVLTAVVWGAVATAASIAAWLGPRPLRRGLALLVLLALALLADDALMVHETLAPRIGVPEEALYLAYTATAVAVAGHLRHGPDRRPLRVLLVAGGLLAVSVALDVAIPESPMGLLVEDGIKLVGALVLATVPAIALAPAVPTRTQHSTAA